MWKSRHVVDVAMLAILDTGEALGHGGKRSLPEGSIFTTTQAITDPGPLSLFLG